MLFRSQTRTKKRRGRVFSRVAGMGVWDSLFEATRQEGKQVKKRLSYLVLRKSDFMEYVPTMEVVLLTTPSFPVYRVHLKKFVFPFYKSQFY